MFKKILLSIMMFAATTVAFANPAPYVGINLGVINNTSSNAGNNEAGFFRGIPVNLFAGYGGFISQGFYLAGELFATLATSPIDDSNDVKTSYSYGFSIIPGVLLSEHTMGFARLGLLRSHFTSVNSNAVGTQVGLGMQTNLTQNVDVRGEYDYTAYRSVGGIKTPHQDAFNLGLVYSFC